MIVDDHDGFWAISWSESLGEHSGSYLVDMIEGDFDASTAEWFDASTVQRLTDGA